MKLLTVTHEAREHAVLVQVKGDIDSSTVDELTDHLTAGLELAATHPNRLLVLDLQRVTFFGSAALNAILDCHEKGRASGTSVRLVAQHANVLQPIEVTELDRIFDIYPTLPAALHGGQPAPETVEEPEQLR